MARLLVIATSFATGDEHMNVIIAIVCVLGTAGGIVFVSTLGLSGWLKAAIVAPVVLLAVYGMARIQPKESESGKTEK